VNVVCDYCGQPAALVEGSEVHPHRPDLDDKQFYKCEPCQAWVGCHPGTTRPLGRLADAELRAAKSAAHAAFDPLWKSRRMTRSSAYAWLAGRLGISAQLCHIGMFDVAMCRWVVVHCKDYQRTKQSPR
jgi:hypothetical protein